MAAVRKRRRGRLNFLDCLHAGHADYVVNDATLAYMRAVLPSPSSPSVIALLAGHPDRRFADAAAFADHLARLRVASMTGTHDPICIATEGALWGSAQDHGFLREAVILSDDTGQFDAGQFKVGRHALCWVHLNFHRAERLVHKLDAFTVQGRQAKDAGRDLIWSFYRDLGAFKRQPTARGRAAMTARFDLIFKRRTGYAPLDRLLKRLHANKAKLLAVPRVPRRFSRPRQNLREARHHLLGLPRRETCRARTS